MIAKDLLNQEIDLIISNAIREDVGEGDHTSIACIPDSACGKAQLLVKEKGIIAGVSFARAVFAHVDPTLEVDVKIKDGKAVEPGDVVFYVEGRSRSILMAERVVLNGMQRMSAIATKANNFSKLLAGTKAKVLDTRKTTPGLRALEKWAVTIGGGMNHRFALYDMVMIKDNHADFAGGISNAIERVKEYLEANGLDLKIIVEARNLEEVDEILKHKEIHRILLDNFSFEDTRKAVATIGNRCLTESSGGIDASTLREYAECGVDFISSGAMTHSVSNLDLSLKAV
ncbi:carboxylating nicotinate-nucleotide diphosphorylase [Croceiramulus getboli]|nr:carboxylating nicotinate-nucleotide diphosphorylase [Flavobacteriaceae bacterium YJPT1-3]